MRAEGKSMKEKTKSIAARQEDYNIFVDLHNARPQDANNADTMAYLLQFHAEMQEFKPHPRKISEIGRTPDPEQVHSRIIVAGEDTP
jgi:hypothetical protein